MKSINYSDFRKNMATLLDQVNQDHLPIMITRQNAKPAIVISVEDFQSYEATAYLMSSRKNAKRLNASIAEIEAGSIKQRKLIKE